MEDVIEKGISLKQFKSPPLVWRLTLYVQTFISEFVDVPHDAAKFVDQLYVVSGSLDVSLVGSPSNHIEDVVD